ncbi:MAG: HAD-IC family P-type ATPase, partial [Gammaproteobacteria bacterium]
MALSAGHSPAWSLRLVHSAVPGRARFRLQALGNANGRAQHAVVALRSLPGVRRVRANPATGTLLIDYAAEEPVETLQERVSVSLSQAFERPVDTDGATADRRSAGITPQAGVVRWLDDLTRLAPRSRTGSARPQPGLAWHAMDHSSLLERLAADGKDGLSAAEVAERLDRYGPNLLPELLPPSALEIWVRQFTTLPVGLLAASGGIALATGGIVDAVAIGAVVLTNAVIGYGTERKSEQTIAALASGSPGEVRVRRAGADCQIPMAELVPGDLLPLLPGTHVPADARVMKSHRLSVDESALTGESMPVTKRAKTVLPADTPLADRDNMVYCGTTITGGSGLAMAVATGPHSELGRIQIAAGRVETPETPMQRQLGQMGGQLALLSAAACAAVFTVGLVRGRSALEMIKSSISLGVAAVPEGLPTVATTTLALGIREMSRRNVAVRQLGAVEALGAVQVFCLDKTGTLTENRMQVTSVHVDRGRHEIRTRSWVRDDQTVDPVGSASKRRLLEMLVLCNESRPDDDGEGLVGTPTENALLELSAAAGLDIEALRRRFPLLKIRYRSEQRHYMVTIHRAGKRRLAAVKGSPAEILPLCRWIMINGRRRVLTDAMRSELVRENERWAGKALRVLA